MNTELFFQTHLSLKEIHQDHAPAQTLLIFDQKLKSSKVAKKLIDSYPYRYGVRAGEKLKDLDLFPGHVRKMMALVHKINQKELGVLALGGGSVGDFSGFFSSVLKRGTRLGNIPSTWLAAIDSAHGGKTALNVKGFKNQIGSFHSAQSIFLIKDLLENQPSILKEDASGEMLKIGLIDGTKLWKSLKKKELDLWALLPQAIQAKYKVVDEDPFERKGYRQILNLGHTLGHVIEAAMGISHGRAVGQGLVFSVLWSHHLGFLSDRHFEDLSRTPLFVKFQNEFEETLQELPLRKLDSYLNMDKKKQSSNSLTFIFIGRPGLCVRQPVKVPDVIKEILRQRSQLSPS